MPSLLAFVRLLNDESSQPGGDARRYRHPRERSANVDRTGDATLWFEDKEIGEALPFFRCENQSVERHAKDGPGDFVVAPGHHRLHQHAALAMPGKDHFT